MNYEGVGYCFGVTKDPNEGDYMLIYSYYALKHGLSKTFGEITWKCKIDELIDKLFDSLNEIINKDYNLRTTNLTNKLFETLKIVENCTSCKSELGKYNLDGFHESINKTENF